MTKKPAYALNDYRIDVDEAMSQAQREHAAEVDRQQVIGTWKNIAEQLRRGKSPFAKMLMQFREEAVNALSEMVYADPNDVKAMAALQAVVLRSLTTMEHVDTFRSDASAAEENDAADFARRED